ncbi:hypothetical protein MTO96_012770 [Rhipicephalus appendiculatus]
MAKTSGAKSTTPPEDSANVGAKPESAPLEETRSQRHVVVEPKEPPAVPANAARDGAKPDDAGPVCGAVKLVDRFLIRNLTGLRDTSLNVKVASTSPLLGLLAQESPIGIKEHVVYFFAIRQDLPELHLQLALRDEHSCEEPCSRHLRRGRTQLSGRADATGSHSCLYRIHRGRPGEARWRLEQRGQATRVSLPLLVVAATTRRHPQARETPQVRSVWPLVHAATGARKAHGRRARRVRPRSCVSSSTNYDDPCHASTQRFLQGYFDQARNARSIVVHV